MRLAAQNIINGFYSDTALSWAAMRAVNWLPEVAEAEGTRTLKKYATPPGLRLLVDLQTNAPVRGLEDVEGRLFAVSGDSLFEITNDLAAINRGSIPGVGRVSMAHNQQGGASAANELAIANGLAGYVYNTDTTVLAQITDDAFEGASTFDYVDGYMSYTDPQGRWWGHSDLNQATQYSSLDRNDAESAPDKIVSHLVSHREVIVWGTRTGEFFRNTGAATGTFQRVDGTEMEVGICATFARARVDNTVCWVGNDLTVYRLNGHAPSRISTRPIEQLLASVDPTTIFCFTWEDRGHKVFYVTSPNNFTVGFDFASNLWHARESYGLAQWRVNALVRWGNRWVAGDYVNGLLYELDWDWYTENGRPMVSQCATGYTWGEQNKLLCPYAELIFDTGGPGGVGYGEAEELVLSGDVPDGTEGDAVSTAYTVTGGIAPYTFAIDSGTFPPGLTLNAVTGAVTGTFSTAGSYSWVVIVTDDDGNTDTLPDTAEVEAFVAPLFVAIDNTLTLKKSTDGGATFPDTVTTGLTDITSEIYVGAAGGKIFHFGTDSEGRVSDDGVSFSGCTGLPFDAGIGNLIHINSEWQAYIDSGNLYVSANGTAFAQRTITSGAINLASMPAVMGARVLCLAAGNRVNLSTDSGATFTEEQIAAFNSFEGINRILAVETFRFILFGRAAGSGDMLIGRSFDGSPGSWTTAAGPATAVVHGVAFDPDAYRIVIVLQTGDTWYSDDEGGSWDAGAAVPYAGAGAFPPVQTNNMIFSGGYFYFCAAQGSGVNRIYRSPDGVTAWAQVFQASPTGNAIHSMCEFTP